MKDIYDFIKSFDLHTIIVVAIAFYWLNGNLKEVSIKVEDIDKRLTALSCKAEDIDKRLFRMESFQMVQICKLSQNKNEEHLKEFKKE